MKFSVILPVYNVEKYLRECVDSILCQTFTDYEIILVDDGSKDNSPEICDELEREYERIKTVHKPNGGLSSARNAGMDIAKGEYIVFIDSDDFIIDKTFLEKVDVKTADMPDLIFFKYKKYFEDEKLLKECPFSYKNAILESNPASQVKALVKDDAFYGMAWIKAIKRTLLIDNGIRFEDGLLGEDMEWNYHLLLHTKKMEFIDEPFLAYRQREGSISKTCKIKNLTDFIYILEKWSENIKASDLGDDFKEALYGSLAKYYSNMLVIYSRVKDVEKKKHNGRIKKLSWLLKYSMSKRPKIVAKVYGLFGFGLTVKALQIIDKR
jgi:glycosyltransferase involved in cell wall biosynthesis